MESLFKGLDVALLTNIFLILTALVFVLSIFKKWKGQWHNFTEYTPTLLTSMGILGTFFGIVVGLLDFNTNDIDGSIEGLLAGLTTAFITSLWGTGLSILYRGVAVPMLTPQMGIAEQPEDVTASHLLIVLQQQQDSLEQLRKTLGADSESSLIGQVKLLRSDMNDNSKRMQQLLEPVVTSLNAIQKDVTEQRESFKAFEERLWIKLQDFADMLSKSATEQVINALNEVIKSFNDNLLEQFGDNFKQLNEAVKALVIWQENYKVQIADMVEQYRLGVQAIGSTERSVAEISAESKAIPEAMANLKQVIELNQGELSKLENHLNAFKDIRDRAVEAVPEIRRQIDMTVSEITNSVLAVNDHYKVLITESDKYVQQHIQASNELLDKFVTNTKLGVDTIGERLLESSQKVEKAVSEGADEFRARVSESNSTLQQTANELTSSTEQMRDYLQDAVSDMNENVRDLINGLVEESRAISKTLSEANKTLITDTTQVRDSVTQGIDTMQRRLESGVEELVASVNRNLNNAFGNMDIALRDQVAKTGTSIDKQMNMLDESMQRELERVMSSMGNSLAQISNQFTTDYGRLVSKMQAIANRAEA